MMSLIDFFKNLFRNNNENKEDSNKEENPKIYSENEETGKKTEENIEITSVWEVLKIHEHTQANHLVSVIPYDEWVDMNEIRRRIWDIFQIEYKNDRSLYPYLKTMVDIGLIETNNIGGKRKWRKKDLLIKKSEKNQQKEEIKEKLLQIKKKVLIIN